jgi:hypothetical protein
MPRAVGDWTSMDALLSLIYWHNLHTHASQERFIWVRLTYGNMAELK